MRSVKARVLSEKSEEWSYSGSIRIVRIVRRRLSEEGQHSEKDSSDCCLGVGEMIKICFT